MKILKYVVKLYGNCGVGLKAGVVRFSLNFIPAQTILGALASSYMLYGCTRKESCKGLRCEEQKCPFRLILKGINESNLAFTHLIPVSNSNSLNDYLIFWLKRKESRKIIKPHIAINRITRNITYIIEKKPVGEEIKGYLYGDEVFTPPSNEFFGYVALKEWGELIDQLKEFLGYINLARLGMRSKYCFIELLQDLKEVSTNEIESALGIYKDNNQRSPFIALTGLCLLKNELDKIKIGAAYLRVLKIHYHENTIPHYVSLYKLLGIKDKHLIISEPLARVYLNGSLEENSLLEMIFFGVRELKLSPLGWNRIIPLSFLKYIEGEIYEHKDY